MAKSTFVAISRFAVANGMADEVAQAFLERPHLVDGAPGFVRMDVIRPVDDPDEFWLITCWEDQACFETWHRGHTYRDSHVGIPKGLKLDATKTSLRFFEYLSS